MKLTLTFLCSCLAITLYAQPVIEWKKNLGGEGHYFPIDFQETSDHGFVIAGTRTTPDYNNNCWVLKMNADQTIAWQKTFGGSETDFAVAVQQTNDGGYILGANARSHDGDVSGHHGDQDFWVIKLNFLGAIQWQRILGGGEEEELTALWQTNDGGYIASGRTTSNDGDISGNHGLSDTWVVKLDGSGNIEWSRSLGGSNDEYASDIQPTVDGGFILTISTNSSNGDLDNNLGELDGWIIKLDAAGAIEWKKNCGGAGKDILYKIRQTPDGGYIAGGHSNSFPGDISGAEGRVDCWILKLTASGEVEWQRTFGGTHDEIVTDLNLTDEGGFVFSAITYSENGDVSVNYGEYDCWIVRLNEAGYMVWQASFGGSYPDRANAILQTADGISFIANTFSFDGNLPATYPNYSNAWIVRLSNPNDTGEPVPDMSAFTLFPNPTSGLVRIVLPKEATPVSIMVTDASGKVVPVKWLNDPSNLDFSHLPSGIYLLDVTDRDGNRYSGKVIRQ